MFQHVPAIFVQRQALALLGMAIEDAQPFGAEHPLVPIGHGEGTIVGLYVEGQGAELLDRVDAEQHAAAATSRADALQVKAQAAGVLHRADRQQAGAWAAGGEQGALGVVTGETDLDHFDAARAQGFPDHSIGGELLVADDDLVALSPIQAEGYEGKRLGGVLDQCEVAAGARIEQSGKALAQAMFYLQPFRIVAGAVGDVLPGEGAHRVGGASRPGCDRCVVEVAQTVGLVEFVLVTIHRRMFRAFSC